MSDEDHDVDVESDVRVLCYHVFRVILSHCLYDASKRYANMRHFRFSADGTAP